MILQFRGCLRCVLAPAEQEAHRLAAIRGGLNADRPPDRRLQSASLICLQWPRYKGLHSQKLSIRLAALQGEHHVKNDRAS